MKYLKTFESVKFKKYIIDSDMETSNSFYIYEVIKCGRKYVELKTLYRYYPLTNRLMKTCYDTEKWPVYEITDFDNISYQSDNLKDCIDKVRVLATEIKFNL